MEQLTRSQFVMLVILVSFVTSIFTGIVTATLVSQAPSPITQTVSRVIEKTAGVSETPKASPSTPQATQEDLVMKIAEDTSSAVASVVASKDLPVIEQYYINPFENDEFFKNLPPEFLPQIQVPQYRQKGTEKKQVSSGTGFFVSEDGYLLTNKHVVADTAAEYSIVMNDGTKLPANVLARDPAQDIAILKVDNGGKKFNYLSLGNSDKIKVGQSVVVIGNTLGEFQNTVSAGIISGLNRTIVASDSAGTTEQLQKIIQTDAAINPGNSGGPLLDLSGRAIGINTALAQGAENVGFALPINIAKKHLSDLKEFGEIRFAYLGVRYTFVNDEVKKTYGIKDDLNYGAILIKGANNEPAVIKDSPADKAGLKEGDVILEYNGVKIDANNLLGELLSNSRVGQKISLKVLSGGAEKEVFLTLDERPKNM